MLSDLYIDILDIMYITVMFKIDLIARVLFLKCRVIGSLCGDECRLRGYIIAQYA